jgi:ABC-2 type transport system ATP-binding protein
MQAIRTVGLTKIYGARRGAVPPPGATLWAAPALADLDLAVDVGEIFGFLGPNGAGKSTTIRLLLGFLHPTAGSGSVLGLDIGRDSVEIRRRTGYLPGGIAFWDTLTGTRLLDEFAALAGRPPVLRQMLTERLELGPETLRRPVRAYSRGMRQKLGIVQALQHDPELAILDEPSEGLDPLMQRAFYEILDERKAAGRTIFFSSHVLSEVERVCDRVAIVRSGRLVAVEDVGRLIAHRRRNVAVRFEGAPPTLVGVPGIEDVVIDGGRLTCRLSGEVGPFLAALRDVVVRDLTIEPASLEEAFLEYYDGAGSAATGRDGAGPRAAGPAAVDR